LQVAWLTYSKHTYFLTGCRDAWTSFDQEQQQQQPQSVLLQYKGPPLVLVEVWQVEVVGSRVARASLVGAVRWTAPEAKALAGSTPFKLQVCAVFCMALFFQYMCIMLFVVMVRCAGLHQRQKRWQAAHHSICRCAYPPVVSIDLQLDCCTRGIAVACRFRLSLGVA
jgi:hypothetical protein